MTYKSFLHQILYAYVGFPDVASLVWRYDSLPAAPLGYYGEVEDIEDQYGSPTPPPGGGGSGGGDEGGDNNGGECPPCGQTLEDGGCTGVNISWNAIANATKYIIQYGRDPRIRGAGQQSVVVTPPTTTRCLELGNDVRFGELIYYRITAKIDGASSITSDVKAILFCPSPANQGEQNENCCKDAAIKIEIDGPPQLISGQPAEEYVASTDVKTKDEAGNTVYEIVSAVFSVNQPQNAPAVTLAQGGFDPITKCELTPVATDTTKIELEYCVELKHIPTNETFNCCEKLEVTVSGTNVGENHPPSNLTPLRNISFTNSLLSVLSSVGSRGNTCCGSAGKTGGTITGMSGTTPGSGSVTLYTLSGGTLSAGSAVTAYNISTGTISSGSWVLVNRDTLGNWWIVVEQC